MWRDLTEIAMALIGVATLTLLVGQADKSAKLISTTANAFGGLLSVVTLQSQVQNPLAGGFSL